jgi:hypothetical protein
MRKIILVALLFVCIGKLYAQPVVNRAGNANTVADGRLMAKLNMFMPVYADTIAANTSRGIDSCYAIIATRDVNGFWYRECSPKRWVRLSGSSVNNTTITNISITNITDSSVNIAICTGDGSCDTTTINNITIESPTTVELLNDSTIQICNADAQCDTAIINRQQFLYFFQNALTQISAGVVEFGGAMLHTTTVTYDGEELLNLYTDRDIGFPNYPTNRVDQPTTNVLGTDMNGVLRSIPFLNPTQYGIVSGGIVTWVEDYDYHVSPAVYYINGIAYQSPDTSITLSPPDATYNRIDAFVVNEDGEVEVIEGTPSSNPSQPSIDPEIQILLTFALVETGTTEPSTINSECAYQENAEWTAASSSARINVASTSNPCGGTYSIEGTSVIKGDYFTLTRSVAFDPRVDHNALILQIKSKGNWGNANQNRKLLISWSNGSAVVGQFVSLSNGSYGFNASNTSDCQTITIPLSNFFLPSTVSITQLLVTAFTTTGSFGFYIDNICLQGGGGITPPPTPQSGVSKFSNLPYIFVTSKPQPDSLTFTPLAFPAYTVFGNATASSANPSPITLTAPMIPTDLGYYKNMEQLTDTSIALIRGDLTRDTIAVTKGSFYATNGLTKRNDSTVVLGGTLDQNTTIAATANYSLTVSGSVIPATASGTLIVTNNGVAGRAIHTTTSGGVGLFASETTGNAINAQATSGNGIVVTTTSGTSLQTSTTTGKAASFLARPATTNTVVDVVDVVRDASVTAANGVGGAINMYVATDAGFARSNSTLIAKWTTAADATRTSEFIVTGVNNATTADLFTLSGNGNARFNKYGVGSFVAGTPTYLIATDANGNYMEVPSGGLSGGTIISANNGLTMSTATNVQLGSASSGPSFSPLLQNTYINTDGFTLQLTGSGEAFKILTSTAGNAANIQNNGVGNALFAIATGGQAVIGQGTFTSTNAVEEVVRINRYSSGIAANNIGASIKYNVETSTATAVEANTLVSKWTDATHATRTSSLIITGVYQATIQDIMVANGTSSGGSVGIGTLTPSNAKLVVVGNSGDPYAAEIVHTSGIGLNVTTTSNFAVSAQSSDGADGALNAVALSTLSGSTVKPILKLSSVYSAGSGSNGIGGSVEYWNEASDGSQYLATQLISKWTDATVGTRTSQYTITGVNSGVTADKFIVKGSGVINIPTALGNYADNAAAITGGLSVGDIYRNGDILQIVH